MIEYCPSCVVELQKDKKKLGILTNWLVCPCCGYRTRPIDPDAEMNQYFYRKDKIKLAQIERDIEEEEE